MMQIEIEEAGRRGAQMIELRLDFLAKAPDFKRLLENKPCPLLATVRRHYDGGRWTGPEDQRQILLRQATVAGFDWIDVETDIANAIPRFRNVKRIVSYHNLRETPEKLEEIYAAMCKQDADVIKIAVLARRPSDNLRVLDLMRNARRPTAAFCMGDMSMPSRILGAKYGAPFAYAAFNKERGVAPGLPSFAEMKDVYHYDAVNADTQVFGVVGDPVAHSLSPLLHNAANRAVGFNGVYLPFHVPHGELPEFLNGFETIPVSGYSVTIPHKEAAAAEAKVRDQTVMLTEAANTLVRGKEGFAAYNTDFVAVQETLAANLPSNTPGVPARLEDLTVLVLGAGGVAHAVAHALHAAGSRVTVTNRNIDRAQKLASEVGCRFVAWEARHSQLCDLLVNCTAVGMHPNVDESPIHASFLKPGLKVFDTIYTPESTLLIKDARTRGCHVVTGGDMFVRQAAAQFRLFTGKEPPLELMRAEMSRALSPLHWRGEQ
jgi:3-dehydroquinate dehydratase/shikimate dehydrogenase